MLWDVLIAAGVGFTQLVITWYAVDVSLKEKRLRNAVIIGLIGAIGIGLTVWGAIRNGLTQQDLQTQLNKIQHNTETPPTVNVPVTVNTPAVNLPQQANSAHQEKQQSIYLETTAAGALTGRNVAISVGKPLMFNIYFLNDGTAVADNAKGIGGIYLSPVESNSNENKAIAQFKEKMKQLKNESAGLVQTGGKSTFWFTASSEQAMTQDDVDKFAKGEQVFYLLSFVSWTDPTGFHYLQSCQVTQVPVFNPEAWHFCRDFSSHH